MSNPVYHEVCAQMARRASFDSSLRRHFWTSGDVIVRHGMTVPIMPWTWMSVAVKIKSAAFRDMETLDALDEDLSILRKDRPAQLYGCNAACIITGIFGTLADLEPGPFGVVLRRAVWKNLMLADRCDQPVVVVHSNGVDDMALILQAAFRRIPHPYAFHGWQCRSTDPEVGAMARFRGESGKVFTPRSRPEYLTLNKLQRALCKCLCPRWEKDRPVGDDTEDWHATAARYDCHRMVHQSLWVTGRQNAYEAARWLALVEAFRASSAQAVQWAIWRT